MKTSSRRPPPSRAGERIWTIPNILSLLRLLAVPVFLWLFVSGRETAGVIVYGVAAWTDFFDGYIARRTNSVTELGKLLDPVSDRIFIVALCVMLIARDVLPWALGAAIVMRDVAILSVFPALERRGVERIRVNLVGKTATAALLFGLTWLAVSVTEFPFARYGDEIGIAFTSLGALLYWIAGIMCAREALRRIRTLSDLAKEPVV